jgi:hypothetical protein
MASEKLKLAPEVVESGDAGEITFFYRISTSSGDIIVPPGKVTTGILESTGLISCKSSGDCRDCAEPPGLFTVENGWFMDDEQADELGVPPFICVQWKHLENSELGRLAAFAAQHQNECWLSDDLRSHRTIIRRGECLQCCFRFIVAQEMQYPRGETPGSGGTAAYHCI